MKASLQISLNSDMENASIRIQIIYIKKRYKTTSLKGQFSLSLKYTC